MKFGANLIIAWLWILLGFLGGMVQGMFFHDENWLGGYTSFKRRLYRLAHISCFGLGSVNLMFAMTFQNSPSTGLLVGAASQAFLVGAISMPICCLFLAHFPKAKAIFSLPVLSLIAGAVLVLLQIVEI